MKRIVKKDTYAALMLRLHLWYLYFVLGRCKLKINKFDRDW
jgi:hypothetical protein